MVIGVEVQTEAHSESILSRAPATGKALGVVLSATSEKVLEAMGRAREAQQVWGARSVEERAEVVSAFARAIVDAQEELVEMISRESGKPRMEALMHDVLAVSMAVDHYARNAPHILAPRQSEHRVFKHRRSYVHYAPRGVVAVVSPWNFPLSIPFTQAITALVAGNAVLLKPSEHAPLVATRAAEIFTAAGGPTDLLQVLTGDRNTAISLIDAEPDYVVFTGTADAGRDVAHACAARLIPHALHLGGNAPAIVCKDADLERTARALVFGGLANSGQTCVSIERVYVDKSHYQPLLERVVELVHELRAGDPTEVTTDLGPLAISARAAHLDALVDDAIASGARLLTGGNIFEDGRFFEPTVLADCNDSMKVIREEIFGPLLPFVCVENDEVALKLANASKKGLAAYVFTRDRDHGRRLSERIRAGAVMINDAMTVYGTPETPFGGVGQSGWGHSYGDEGLRQMCELRQVNYGVLELSREPLWFPYGEAKYSATSKAARLLFSGGSAMRRVLDLL